MRTNRCLARIVSKSLAIYFLLVGSASGDEEIRYRPYMTQFVPKTAKDDPCVLILQRIGASKERTAEYTVFELVDKGHRLRKLSATTARNSVRAMTDKVLGRGRFLVTFDELEGFGITDNCLVIYDFVRKSTVAMKLEDFVPADVRAKLRKQVEFFGVEWWRNPVIDYQNLTIYTASPAQCKEFGLPFIVIDVRSQKAEVRPVPAALPPTTDDSMQHLIGPIWDWSMGGKADPDIHTKFAYPTYLKIMFRPQDVTTEFRDGLEFAESACYELDPASGDYARCAPEKWVPRPDAKAMPTDKQR
jgi:hypothetical protein